MYPRLEIFFFLRDNPVPRDADALLWFGLRIKQTGFSGVCGWIDDGHWAELGFIVVFKRA